MECTIERDDSCLGARGVDDFADLAGEFDGGFVGFGAGVADEDAGGVVHAAGFEGLVNEELGEGASPGVIVEVRGVDESFGLDVGLARCVGARYSVDVPAEQ